MRSRPSGRRPIRQAKQASQPDLRVIPCKSLDGLLALTAAVRLQKGLVVMDRTALGYLTDLNRNVEGALALLEKLAEYPELNNEDFIIFQSYFREYLGDTNMMILDALEESEQETMLKANRERVAYEKKIRDPDDCYFDVRNREQELRAQGLPSKIGNLARNEEGEYEGYLLWSRRGTKPVPEDVRGGSDQRQRQPVRAGSLPPLTTYPH